MLSKYPVVERIHNYSRQALCLYIGSNQNSGNIALKAVRSNFWTALSVIGVLQSILLTLPSTHAKNSILKPIVKEATMVMNPSIDIILVEDDKFCESIRQLGLFLSVVKFPAE